MGTTAANELGIRKHVAYGFDEAITKVTDALKAQGFGILTEIDVKHTLKEKLDVDFRRYRILGACNPPFAHKALLEEPLVGLMMPCNVIVYDADGGGTEVVGFDPNAMLSAFDRPQLTAIAAEISQRMRAAIEAV
jgi:uncharacterized protein (DUF302 family)